MNDYLNRFLIDLSIVLSVVVLITFAYLFLILFIKKVLLQKKAKKEEGRTFKVKVDYDQSLEEMLKPLGDCLIGKGINNENFPINKKGIREVEMKIFNYGRDMNTLHVFHKMKSEGFMTGNLFEMVALIKENPKELEDITLIALGSFYTNARNQFLKPYFYSGEEGRELDLDEDDGDWPEYCSFLGVKYK